jgi:hypothetical protein
LQIWIFSPGLRQQVCFRAEFGGSEHEVVLETLCYKPEGRGFETR